MKSDAQSAFLIQVVKNASDQKAAHLNSSIHASDAPIAHSMCVDSTSVVSSTIYL